MPVGAAKDRPRATRARSNTVPGTDPGSSLREVGTTGLTRFGGLVYEEYLRELQGPNGRRIFRDMAESNPVIGAALLAMSLLIRQVPWIVTPFDQSTGAAKRAEFAETILDDMSGSWSDTLSEILSMLTYGWSLHEVVLKRRLGPNPDPKLNSKHSDGRIGVRKLAVRAQETLWRWEFNDSGEVVGMWQLAPPLYQETFIPMAKALLFRPSVEKGNPEGKSILRSAFTSWYALTNIQRIEGIGIERDLAGYPVAYVPPRIMSPSASQDEQSLYQSIKDIVVNIRRDEIEGAVFPLVYDDSGKPLYDLRLLNSGGSRQFNVSQTIERYEKRIATSVLADFVLLGQDQVGSFALAQPLTSQVLTPAGYVRMGDVSLGQRVVDPLGQPSVVSAIHEHAPREVYRVHFADGRVVEASDDHRWVVTTPYWQRQGVPSRPRLPWAPSAPQPYPQLERFGILTTAQMKGRMDATHQGFRVPSIAPITYDRADKEPLPLDPYILGLLLGDGCIGSEQGSDASFICTMDQEIVDEIRKVAPRARVKPTRSKCLNVYLTNGYGPKNPFTEAIRGLGLRGHTANSKFIPSRYQSASIVDRIALLQGLMDTDGCCTNGQNIYTTVSTQLADDIELLLRGLGASSIYRRIRYDQVQPVHTIDFDIDPSIVPFKLSRKVERYRRKSHSNGSVVVAIEATGRIEPMRCLSVTAPSRMYITDGFIPTHNSEDKSDLFAVAIGAWLDVIAQVLNDELFPLIFRLNGMPTKDMPRAGHGDIATPNLAELGGFIAAMASSQMIHPDAELEAHLRKVAKLPPPPLQTEDQGQPGSPSGPPAPNEQPPGPEQPGGDSGAAPSAPPPGVVAPPGPSGQPSAPAGALGSYPPSAAAERLPMQYNKGGRRGRRRFTVIG